MSRNQKSKYPPTWPGFRVKKQVVNSLPYTSRIYELIDTPDFTDLECLLMRNVAGDWCNCWFRIDEVTPLTPESRAWIAIVKQYNV